MSCQVNYATYAGERRLNLQRSSTTLFMLIFCSTCFTIKHANGLYLTPGLRGFLAKRGFALSQPDGLIISIPLHRRLQLTKRYN